MLMHALQRANKMNISSSAVFSTVILGRYKRGLQSGIRNESLNERNVMNENPCVRHIDADDFGERGIGRGCRKAAHRVQLEHLAGVVLMTLMTPSYCQQADTTNNKAPEFEAKRIFWIIPNFRMSPTLVPYKPITAAEKFHIATLDSFDRGTFALGALFGAEAQLTKANPSFGQVCGLCALVAPHMPTMRSATT